MKRLGLQLVFYSVVILIILPTFSCTYYQNREVAGDCYKQFMENYSKDIKAGRQIDSMIVEMVGKKAKKIDLCSQPNEYIEGSINFDVIANGQVVNISLADEINKIGELRDFIVSELSSQKISRTTNDTLHICFMYSYKKRNCH